MSSHATDVGTLAPALQGRVDEYTAHPARAQYLVISNHFATLQGSFTFLDPVVYDLLGVAPTFTDERAQGAWVSRCILDAKRAQRGGLSITDRWLYRRFGKSMENLDTVPSRRTSDCAYDMYTKLHYTDDAFGDQAAVLGVSKLVHAQRLLERISFKAVILDPLYVNMTGYDHRSEHVKAQIADYFEEVTEHNRVVPAFTFLESLASEVPTVVLSTGVSPDHKWYPTMCLEKGARVFRHFVDWFDKPAEITELVRAAVKGIQSADYGHTLPGTSSTTS